MALTTNFQTGGTDIGGLFAPYITGGSLGSVAQVGTTGYQVASAGNADLNVFFAALAHGSARGAIGYQTDGTDLSSLFASVGTTLYVVIEGSGSGTFTIPTDLPGGGGVTLTIQAWGGGGGGGNGSEEGGDIPVAGAIGGEGAYVRSTFTLTNANDLQTIAFSIGAGGAAQTTGNESVVSSGSFSMTTMTAGGGHGGNLTVAGTGGTASGGNAANQNGTTGAAAGITGVVSGDGSPYGGGGAAGAAGTGTGGHGKSGAIVFSITA
jgi:hypothetical protein